MADFSSTFLDFLKAYDSSAYAEVTAMAPNDPKALEAFEARKNEIFAAWKDKEAVWESIPQAIRDRYPGRPVPQDIMDAATRGEIDTLRALEYDASLKTAQEAREKVERVREEAQKWQDVTAQVAVDVAVAAAVVGYTMETCHVLAAGRQTREDLLAKVGGDPKKLSEEDKKLWRKSREEGKHAVLRDVMQNMPERMLLRMLALHSRDKTDPKTFARDIAELVKRIENSGRQEKLLALLKKPRFKHQMKHYKPETLDILQKNVLPYIPKEAQELFLKHLEEVKDSKPIKKVQNVNERPAENEMQKALLARRSNQNENARTL